MDVSTPNNFFWDLIEFSEKEFKSMPKWALENSFFQGGVLMRSEQDVHFKVTENKYPLNPQTLAPKAGNKVAR